MRVIAFLLFLASLAALAAAGFSFSSLSVTIAARPDGSAHVSEDIRIFIDDRPSIEIYDAGIAITNDITSWKVRTNISEVRHHVDRQLVDVRNIIVRPQPRDTCNSFLGTCYATIKMEYDAYPIIENGTVVPGTGLFTAIRYKPRTTNYSLNARALSFESTQTGEIVLGDNQVLTIKIPPESVVTYIDPLPETMRERTLPLTGIYSFSWRGRTTLADFQLRYQIEQPLKEEVVEFFASLEGRARALLFSAEGAALILLSAIAILSWALLRRRE
ncbi:MAG: hypothetical protein QXG98_03065 [Candidatus Micrarchaeia archaeon]